MAISSLVAGGVGPGSSVPLLLTGGLALGEEPPPAETPDRPWTGGMIVKMGRLINPAIVMAIILLS